MPLFNFFRRHKGIDPETSNQIHSIIGDQANRVRNNPNFGTFDAVSNNISDIVNSRAVLNRAMPNELMMLPDCYTAIDEIHALPIITNKQSRIKQYRTMSALPECDWCLEEIADDFIHEDETGKFIRLKLPLDDSKINATRKEYLQNEFERFIGYFNLKDEGFNMMKRFLIEGELAWENVINPKRPELGIIGVRFIPCEYYETLIDMVSGAKVGLFIDQKQYHQDIKTLVSQSFFNSRQIFNNVLGTNNIMFNREDCIPMAWPQLTYISSGDISPDGMICFPLIEKAKQAYYQYVLMKDAAVILRVTRAPERLLFNIDTGNLPQKIANDYVRKFGNQLRQKKVIGANKTQGGMMDPNIVGTYNPTTMLESWIFSKGSNGSQGTTVDSVGSTAQYDQIEDLKFFQKALLKQFKIPWSRFEAPESINEQSDSQTYEEYTFSRMLIRLQRRFAIGFKNAFIVHLKLRGMWEQYELNEHDIDVDFQSPVLYDLTKIQRLMETKVAAYATLADREEFSKQLAMEKILGMSKDEIKENFDKLVQEKVWLAGGEYYTNKVSDETPPEKVLQMIHSVTEKNDVDDIANDESSESEDEQNEEGGNEEVNSEENNKEINGEENQSETPEETPNEEA